MLRYLPYPLSSFIHFGGGGIARVLCYAEVDAFFCLVMAILGVSFGP